MVIAFGQADLFIGKVQSVTDPAALPEIHGCSVDRKESAGGQIAGASFRKAVGCQSQYGIGTGGTILAAQIEISMVGQIEDRRLVRLGLVDHAEGIVLFQGIGDLKLQGAGVAFLAVRAGIFHDQGTVLFMRRENGPGIGSVQMVGAVIGFQLPGDTVQRKNGIFDPVGKTAYQGTVVAAAVLIIFQRVVAQGHIGIAAVPGRDQDLLDRGAVGQEIDLHAGCIGHGIPVDGNAVFCDAKCFFKNHSHVRTPFFRKYKNVFVAFHCSKRQSRFQSSFPRFRTRTGLPATALPVTALPVTALPASSGAALRSGPDGPAFCRKRRIVVCCLRYRGTRGP